MPRLSLTTIQQRLAGLSEGAVTTLKLNDGLILFIRGEGGDPKLADYHAWIPNFDGEGNLWTYLGEIDGLMALISEYRKRKPKK